MKRILWMSRHEPHEAQLAELRRLFGDDVVVEQESRPFDSAEAIARRYRSGRCDDLVVVAPLSVLDHLCRMGLKPLWAESVEENDPARVHFSGARGQGFRFVRFRRVKRLTLEFEDKLF